MRDPKLMQWSWLNKRETVREAIMRLTRNEYVHERAKKATEHIASQIQSYFQGNLEVSVLLGNPNCLKIVVHDFEQGRWLDIDISAFGSFGHIIYQDSSELKDLGQFQIDDQGFGCFKLREALDKLKVASNSRT